MYDFDYRRPATIAEAVSELQESQDGRFLAGGMTLIPTLKLRLAQPTTLLDLSGIPDLGEVGWDNGALLIGALTTHAEVAGDGEVRARIPALAALAGGIGDPQVRNRGTIGGAIANADPAADYPAALLALGATVVTNERRIAADDFFTDMFETALHEAEIVTGVSFPVPERAAYAKFPHPASRYAIVGVMVAQIGPEIRVAVTGAGPSVFRIPEMEQALAAGFVPQAVEGIIVADEALNSDLHASAEYRAHLVGVMARRAVSAVA